MRKVLIASPLKGGLSPSYVRGLLAVLFANWEGRYKFDWACTTGTSVAMARDELANIALIRGDDDLVFWDADLTVMEPTVFVSMVNRLLSHDVDVVGGAYVGHNFISQFHGASHSTDTKTRSDGLIQMAQIPLGFSKIRTSVFRKLKETHPHLQYTIKETGRPPRTMFEFFPNGVVGPNTLVGKYERLKAYIESDAVGPGGDVCYSDLKHIIKDSDYSQNLMLGEDFYFCKLAREAGIEMFIDNNLIVPHETSVRLPVKNQMILEELGQEWRWDGGVDVKEVRKIIDSLRPKMVHEIP